MEESNKKTEILVGVFLTFGLALIGLLFLQFSAVREIFKDTYSLTVPFADGTGIKAGTPVILGGSRVGKVSDRPRLNATFNGVIIPLEIYETVRIPTDAKFGIGTSGLLGDSYIEIRTSGANTGAFIEPGAAISEDQIAKAGGLGGLQDTALNVGKKVDLAIEDIQAAVADLRLSLKRINEGALSEQSSTDLREAIASFNKLVKRLDEDTLGDQTSKDLKDAVSSFKNMAASLEVTMKKLDPAIEKLDSTFEKTDTLLGSADGAMKSIDGSAKAIGNVATDIRRGDGLLPALLHDETLKIEFRNLISNLRQRGVLFYKDKSGETEDAPARQRTTPATGTRR
ncbi:MCE family protein [Phragmitibacter flavus]|uniref:MCE family protein n=1 Tax=Phragmitibacter flavus TaxID=2576071 RepID=A0A5R8K758_9BACT|nr:MlaD family protein [Phragmitibacter flavus]TLD68200.1 MCE family protein [Phragmitibacter flavus]